MGSIIDFTLTHIETEKSERFEKCPCNEILIPAMGNKKTLIEDQVNFSLV